jgi:hypothetical protein
MSLCRFAQPGFVRAIALAITLLLGASPVSAADDNKLKCIEAHEQAQMSRHDGHLRSSRRDLLVCTRSLCPGIIQKECGSWLEQINGEQPTVVFSVRDEKGADATAVRVLFDGELLVERLDGRPIEVDPGEHTFRFELPSGKSSEQRILLREGEKNRSVAVTFAPAPPPSSPIPPPALALQATESQSSNGNVVVGTLVGVVGLAALGGAITFAVLQNSNASSAQAACQNGCVANSPGATQAESDVSSAKTQRILEGASFGVAGVALGIASYFFIARPLKVNREAPSPPSAGLNFDASPRGAKILWQVSF